MGEGELSLVTPHPLFSFEIDVNVEKAVVQ